MTGSDNSIEFPFKLLNLYEKELSNIDTKRLNTKMKEKFGSGITLTNNEIKDIMKVICKVEEF